MDVQVLKLATKLGQAFQTTERARYFRIKYECRCLCVSVCVCVCVYVCVCACCTPSPKVTSIISSSTYCKNLLDEEVMEIKNYFLAISLSRKIWAAKVVLPWLVPQNRELFESSENCLRLPRTV